MAHLKTARLTALGLAGLVALAGAATALGCAEPTDDSEGASSDLTASPDLVISQVYGGGGNTGAQYTHDFIELFNRGTATASLAGKSIQYVASGQNFSAASGFVTLPNATVQPGHYYLIRLAGGPTGDPLPAVDLTTSGAQMIKLSNDKGKVALVKSDAKLDGCGTTANPCTLDDVIDFVGYGGASQSEGAPTATLSNALAAIRKGGGCVDTGNNKLDFEAAAPADRSAASPSTPACSPDGGGGAVPDASVNPDAKADGGDDDDDASAPAMDGGADGGGGTTADGGDDPAPTDAGIADAKADAKPPKDGGSGGGTGGGSGGGKKDSGASGGDDNPSDDPTEDEDGEDEDPTEPPSSTTTSPTPGGGKKGSSSSSGSGVATPRPPAAVAPDCSMSSGPIAPAGNVAGIAGVALAFAALGNRRRNRRS